MQQRNDHYSSEAGMLGTMFKGAMAGAVGVWAMDRLDWFLFRNEDPQASHRTEQVRPQGLDPAHVAAKKAARLMGTSLQPAQTHPAGVAIHYALGIGPATVYAAMRERLPVTAQGQDFLYGMGLGLGLFLIQDEGLNQLMGLSGKQKDYPWQAHARGLAAHLVLGLTINMALNVMRAPRSVPQQLHPFDERLNEKVSEHISVISDRDRAYPSASTH